MRQPALRHLVVVLGDQLNLDASAFDGFDASRDLAWMAEVEGEATAVWSSRTRIAVFLSAMRHHAAALRSAGRPLRYRHLDEPGNRGTLEAELAATIQALRPEKVVVCQPGDWGVLQRLKRVCAQAGVELDVREDRHFMCSIGEFAAHARARRTLRMEVFYREMRRRHRVLMEDDADAGAGAERPAGGVWNLDAENRHSFGRDGPGALPAPPTFAPDDITRDVLSLVRDRFATHPGTLGDVWWPADRPQALQMLRDFIEHRLAWFGPFQDAMWPGEPWLYHSQLAVALNLKLLDPREVIARAEAAWRAGDAPLPSVEGFVRQILGWREYVRGVYWTRMPDYADSDALAADEPLPAWYWSGETGMRCLADAIGQTLSRGYAHHIQRLMVTGLYALLLGVRPREVHAWYLAVYADAVEWVELPNVIGMSQFADGGVMSSKPYVASGRYIERMGGGYCARCRYDPSRRTGDDACPFTTLYWDFLLRHESRMRHLPRMSMQIRNLASMPAEERARVQAQAAAIRRRERATAAPPRSAP